MHDFTAGIGLSSVMGLALAGLVASTAPGQAQQSDYIMATASTGGTYYPVGVAISTLIKTRLQPSQGIGMSAISSAGSAENVRLLRDGEAQFAIIQGLWGYDAYNGTGPFESDGSQDYLRSVSMLWQNVEHFVVANDVVDTGTISDLQAVTGESMAFGAQNSGAIGSNDSILSGFDLSVEDYDLVYGGYGPSAEALQNGQVSGISIPAGVPMGAISQLFASAGGSVSFLEFTEEQVAQADGGRDLWTQFVIPAGTYPGQEAEVATIAQPNVMVSTADTSEEDVYEITKAMYENLAFLNAIHPATEAMNIEQAITGLPVPLHPGAVRYYEEVGVEIPDRLMPPA